MRAPRGQIALVLFALFISGIAAIINQTIWQRALKVYLSGSEAISSLIVVLVFMLGLGIGSLYLARSARSIRNPLLFLSFVEFTLAIINGLISFGLSRDISESLYAIQKAALSIGVPLRLLYALVSTIILLVPCFLMGITMPLVSEASQRQLRVEKESFLTILFFLNTLGAVLGGLISGYYLLPYLGQHVGLLLAALLNAAAGLVLYTMYYSMYRTSAEAGLSVDRTPAARSFQRYDVLGFVLGFLALAYEMYLFRIATLSHFALPYTFSASLCAYLLLWSIGVFLARWVRLAISTSLALTALVLVLTGLYYIQGAYADSLLLFALQFSVPCILFGIAFGQVVKRVAVAWGNDVGRFYGLNTFGSCLGILLTVLIGYTWPPIVMLSAICFAYLALAVGWKFLGETQDISRPQSFNRPLFYTFCIMSALVWTWYGDRVVRSYNHVGTRLFLGAEGVVEVRNGKQMIWDGLWHSDLSNGEDHVGTKNWHLAIAPLMAHTSTRQKEAVVVGMGTGITAATLARSGEVASVDVYEINRTLGKLLDLYPTGTLNLSTNPKTKLLWQDGRTGLATSNKKYDIITQQPFYLKQAGSSILLSKEYMQLVKRSLRSDGIFCIYCNSFGNEGQALIVRQTAETVFPFCESFSNGYMILASQQPFTISRERVEMHLKAAPENDIVAGEIRRFGADSFADLFDQPRLKWRVNDLLVTDNHPVTEYPEVSNALMMTGWDN